MRTLTLLMLLAVASLSTELAFGQTFACGIVFAQCCRGTRPWCLGPRASVVRQERSHRRQRPGGDLRREGIARGLLPEPARRGMSLKSLLARAALLALAGAVVIGATLPGDRIKLLVQR